MSLSPCPTFDVVIDTFLRDRSSPSPVLEELHPGLRTERDALSAAFRRISELDRLAGDAEPSSQITVDMFMGAVRETHWQLSLRLPVSCSSGRYPARRAVPMTASLNFRRVSLNFDL